MFPGWTLSIDLIRVLTLVLSPSVQMKLFLNLWILCCYNIVCGASMKHPTELTQRPKGMTAQSLKRTTRKRNKSHNHEHNFHDALDRLMRTRIILHDESTYYDVILSGAETLDEVNAVFTKRNPRFVSLSQEELDVLVNHWLFKCSLNEWSIPKLNKESPKSAKFAERAQSLSIIFSMQRFCFLTQPLLNWVLFFMIK